MRIGIPSKQAKLVLKAVKSLDCEEEENTVDKENAQEDLFEEDRENEAKAKAMAALKAELQPHLGLLKAAGLDPKKAIVSST